MESAQKVKVIKEWLTWPKIFLIVACLGSISFAFLLGQLLQTPFDPAITFEEAPPRPTFSLTIDAATATGDVDAAIIMQIGDRVIPSGSISEPFTPGEPFTLYTEDFVGTFTITQPPQQERGQTEAQLDVTDLIPTADLFVASKNGSKYYFPDCSHAKRIKPENLVDFPSAAAAEQAGYEPSACVSNK